MRKLFVILLFAFCAANTLFGSSRAYRVEDIPNVQAADRTRFVSNPDGLLSQSAVYRIDTMLYSLKESGRGEYICASDKEALNAFKLLCRTEGIIPALESSHALAGALRIAAEMEKDKIIGAFIKSLKYKVGGSRKNLTIKG